MTDRTKRARLKALTAQIGALENVRRAALPWGTPWCNGRNCQGPACEGCAVVAWHHIQTADIAASIGTLQNEAAALSTPVVTGELFAMVGNKWVTA